ncbi:hypothetical protein SEA_BANJO_91 [Mycobacterium phage Banjo]|uniref:Uncharacterized protein n=4 Tax=Pegunavirus TaxID=1623295 RepID=A0A088FPZ3_9CAUD|nr:hypothetical protein AU159_gp093 [Mycobacterium phage Colbert]AID59093.1 hypothetical protein PBI_EMPTEE_94 [Mycobacterium phage EmpTee]AIM49832.1 hypothetical protein PBI_LASSO_94 [Mycobacterium phage Lasso]AUV60495.1 hypothetical protein SEA_HAIMAS_92 [Mycobacterium phage Haimas]AVD99937.1 hypothetical protein SEA_HIGHSTUMP_97 [Mycobacterium phage HighStump]AWN02227.1 hypothetical protein SEA_BANJO_91 [Mycobacterium phage Banjo]AXQ64694.1 hypothetical protein SEA_PHAREON_92 [Mycobacteriu
MGTKAVVQSRVINVNQTITSPTGVAKASKARETLATAREILYASGNMRAADAITPALHDLTRQIADYYRRRAEADKIAAQR